MNDDLVARYTLHFVPSIARPIAKSIQRVCDNIQIAFKNTNNVGKLFSKLKYKQKLSDSRNVVYRIDCKGCDKCYIGTTGQKLCKRLKQHESDELNERSTKSALAFHATKHKHKFDFENARVLERKSIYRKRKLLEEIHIKASKNCMNLKSIESKNVSDIYTNLFKICHQ